MSSPTYRPGGTVKFRGKDYQLFRRTPNDTCPLSFRVTVDGKRKTVSTDTPDLSLAKVRAKQLLAELFDGEWDSTMNVVQKPKGIPNVGEWIDAFHDGDQHVRHNTAKNYERSLLVILKQARGWRPEVARRQKIDVLTAELAKKWQAKRQGRDSVTYVDPLECNTSINSTLRQARALFGRRHIAEAKSKGWVIPETLEGFLKAPNVKEVSHTYDPIPDKVLAKIKEALPDLKLQDERLWAFHLMCRLMGLRQSEILRSRRHWMINRAGRWFLAVNRREGEEAPKRSDREVPIPQVLVKWFEENSDDYLIPATGKTQREEIAREHSKWLRKFIGDERTKTNHELRKHAGSVVAMKTNSYERAADFLGIDIETAKAHYLSFIRPMDPLTEDDL